MTIIHQDSGVGGVRGGGGMAGNGTLGRFLGKLVLVISKNYSIRLDLKNYIDTMIYMYFLLMFFFFDLF